jgi:hypothetical protein
MQSRVLFSHTKPWKSRGKENVQAGQDVHGTNVGRNQPAEQLSAMFPRREHKQQVYDSQDYQVAQVVLTIYVES